MKFIDKNRAKFKLMPKIYIKLLQLLGPSDKKTFPLSNFNSTTIRGRTKCTSPEVLVLVQGVEPEPNLVVVL